MKILRLAVWSCFGVSALSFICFYIVFWTVHMGILSEAHAAVLFASTPWVWCGSSVVAMVLGLIDDLRCDKDPSIPRPMSALSGGVRKKINRISAIIMLALLLVLLLSSYLPGLSQNVRDWGLFISLLPMLLAWGVYMSTRRDHVVVSGWVEGIDGERRQHPTRRFQAGFKFYAGVHHPELW